MISVEEAVERVRAAFTRLPPEQVSLPAAFGRILAEDAVARVTAPPFPVSAMDGYAVRATDIARIPASLRVIGESPAGGHFPGTVGPGQAVRIFTGAPVPAGADCIVIQENVEAGGETIPGGEILVRETAAAGLFIRPAGMDFRAGEAGLAAGRRLGPDQLALAAAMNLPWLKVTRRPRVAILATGDELVMPGDPLGDHQILCSNSLGLQAAVQAYGGEAIDLGIAADSRDSLLRLAAGAKGADLLITSGGASVGDHDLVQSVLGERGLKVDFWKVAMRPGKPLIFGRLGDIPLLGFPGNPVSTLICARLYLAPAMAAMLGVAEPGRPLPKAKLGVALNANDGRQDYLRARLSFDEAGAAIATPFPRQDSAMLACLAAADCLILRPPRAPAAAAGEEVPILPLGSQGP